MNKKLLAVAVAGLFLAPAAALAQSSVTISGYMKGSVDTVKVGGETAAVRTGNKSETRVTDHSSRILFNVVEDLGGGMQAIGQFDLRIGLDQVGRTSNATTVAPTAAVATTPSVNPLSNGNNHVGLRSSSWGTIKIGRQDTHYGNSGDTITGRAGHLGAHNASLFDCVQRPGSAQACAANLSRTANLVWYDSPKWGGFTFMVGMSTNPTRVSTTPEYENDLGTTGRKGRAWTFNPVYDGGNWQIAWSHWNSKSDWSGAPVSQANTLQAINNAVPDEKADSVRGHYVWGGLRVGLGFNRTKTSLALTGQTSGKRSAWALPVSYNWGPHTVYGTYTKAGNTSCDSAIAACAGAVAAGTASNNGARLMTLAYNYDLSKRTSVAVTYINLKNQSNGAYNLFYQGDSAFGGTNGGSLAGEDWKLWGASLRHNF